MELKCKVQTYSWGKIGSSSKVANLAKICNSDFIIEETSPYAELWMGAHVNAPSIIKKTGESLFCYIQKNPSLLGSKVAKRFNNQLPFLLKVLSVNKALSIQAHPNKKHAEELFAKHPDIYKDPNHKPEMAIALTHFEALCGFRPIEEIRWFVNNIPELKDIVKSDDLDDESDFLKASFRSVLTCSKSTITSTINNIITRFKTLDNIERTKYLADLIEKLNFQFPGDNGVLMIYFLNHIQLNPSECIYLGANEIHAYIYGDCVEIMASSDNVVRAGLTPKFVDVDTLCSMLVYKGENPEDKKFKPLQEDEFTKVFKPPVEDFSIAEIKIPPSIEKYKTIKRDSASIVIVVNGSCVSGDLELRPGVALFLEANQDLELTKISSLVELYQGFTNV